MFCEKCGAECKDGAKFCSKCGAPLQSDSLTNGESISAADSENNAPSGGWFQQHKKIALTILIVIIAVVVVIVAVSVARHSSKDTAMSPEGHLERGIQYLEDGEYEEAVKELTAILAIEPNMQAYRYLADAYLDLSEVDPTSEVKAEFADNVYEGTAHEVYVDIAGEVYEEAVAYALDTYNQTEEFPEGTVDMYDDAVAYGIKYGDVQGLSDLSSYILNNDSDSDKDTSGYKQEEDHLSDKDNDNVQDERAPSIGDVEELLGRIRYRCAEDLCMFYDLGNDYVLNYSKIDADEAFSWVGSSLDEPDETGWSEADDRRWYIDGKLYQEDELNSEQELWAEYYITFPTDYFEEALEDMFGYNLGSYNLNDDDLIIQDSDGSYYIDESYFRGDVFAIQNVTVSIVYISEEPDQNGDYTVIAKYEGDNITGGVDQSSHETYFMQFRLRPDQNSKYGYVIAGMTPAGDDEVDEEYRSMVKDSDDSDVVEVPGDYLCSYSSDRLITDADLAEIKAGNYGSLPAGKSLEQMIINEIYAKHGYKFTTPEIQAYFDDKSWYQAIGSYEGDMSVVESSLSDIEKQNVDYLNNK